MFLVIATATAATALFCWVLYKYVPAIGVAVDRFLGRPCHIWNEVWMHVEDAQIFSYFCKDQESLEEIEKYLKDEHKRISRVPREIFPMVGNKLQAVLKCDTPPDMQIIKVADDQFEIMSPALQSKWVEICYEPCPNPAELRHTTAYKLPYRAKLFNCEDEPIDGGFSTRLAFRWPLRRADEPHQQASSSSSMPPPDDSHQQASPSNPIHVSNIRVEKGDVHVAGQNSHVDRRNQSITGFQPRESSSEYADSPSSADYYGNALKALSESCAWDTQTEQAIRPEGGSLQQDKFQILVPPGAVSKAEKVTMIVSSDPKHQPDLGTAVSRSFKCQPSKFKKSVDVHVRSWIIPKPGKKLKADIMSKKDDADPKKILETYLTNEGAIKYRVPHFCWHIAVVSEEEEKKGVYHLFNDVWMQKETGRILSLFWKDEIFLKKGSKALEADHKRIISVPGTVIVSVGSIIKVKLQCQNTAGSELLFEDGSNSTLEITHKAMKKNFLSLLFDPIVPKNATFLAERLRTVYRTKVFNTKYQPQKGGSCTLLHYKWPCIREPVSAGAGQKSIGMSISGSVGSVTVAGGEYTISGSHQYNKQVDPNPQRNEAVTSQETRISGTTITPRPTNTPHGSFQLQQFYV